MNVDVVLSDVDANVYLVALLRPVVDSGKLPTYARTSDEAVFFQRNNATTLIVPIFVPEPTKFNGASLLLGSNGFC